MIDREAHDGIPPGAGHETRGYCARVDVEALLHEQSHRKPQRRGQVELVERYTPPLSLHVRLGRALRLRQRVAPQQVHEARRARLRAPLERREARQREQREAHEQVGERHQQPHLHRDVHVHHLCAHLCGTSIFGTIISESCGAAVHEKHLLFERFHEREEARAPRLGPLEENREAQIHERFREVDVLLALVRDGDRADRHVGALYVHRQQKRILELLKSILYTECTLSTVLLQV